MKTLARIFPLVFSAMVLAFAAIIYALPGGAATPIALTIPNSNASGQSTLTPPVPAYTDALVLSPSVSQTQTVPSGSNFVIFSGACNFFAAPGASASVPSSTTTTGGAAMQNPAGWWLTGQSQVTVIAATSCIVTLSFYK